MAQGNDYSRSTATFHVNGISEHADSLKQLARINPDWKIPVEQLVAEGKTDQKIYKLKFTNGPVNLQKDTGTGALNVLIDGHHVGYIRPEETMQAKNIIKNYEIQNVFCGIWGGQYKTVDDYGVVEDGRTGFSVTIRIVYEDPVSFVEPEPAPAYKAPPKPAATKKAPEPPKKKKKSIFKRWWFWVILIVILLASCGKVALSEPDQPETFQEATAGLSEDSSPVIPKETSTPAAALSDSGSLGDYDVQIDGYQLAKDYANKPAILVDFTFTNNSEENASVTFSLIYQAYQNGVQLDTAIMMDDSIYNANDLMKDVQPGSSISVRAAYELTSDTAPVEFEVSEIISFSDEKLGKTFEISEGGTTVLSTAPVGDFSGAVNDYTVSIVSYKLTKDYEGKKVILFNLGFTNNSDSTANFSTAIDFSVFQNGVELETAIMSTDETGNGGNSLLNVKPGAGLPVTAEFLLSSDTSPIDVEITDFWGFSSDKLKTQISLS